MGFEMCQGVTIKGTEYFQDPEAGRQIELDGVEVRREICGDTYRTADEAAASFQKKMHQLSRQHFLAGFLSVMRISEVVPDATGPELKQVKSCWNRFLEALLATSVDTPYGF